MKWLVLILAVWGCAQVTSLNLRRHQFGRQPTKIVWFQVAGLDHEQLAMLRFGLPTVADQTALEGSLCTGHAWTFNLYRLRPTAQASMLSQLTGKKDIAGTCEDWRLKPVWGYLSANGYKTGIMEVDARNDESLLASKACGEKGAEFLGDSMLWSMRASMPMGSESYLPVVAQDYRPGKTYWDKTCGPNGCGSALHTALNSLYGQFSRNSGRHLFVVRDFSLKHALEKQSINQARDALREIDKAIEGFYRLTNTYQDLLVIVSGAASIDVDFPEEGAQWKQFDLKGSNAVVRKGELSIPVFAQGARAENFCGFYEEAQLFERLLSGPRQQGLELKIINPFLN